MPRFRNLTKAQEEAFARISINLPPEAAPRTLRALLDAGLIEEGAKVIGRDRFGEITVPVYYVPIPVHMEWCDWCEKQSESLPF